MQDLEAALAARPLRSPGPLELEQRGFLPPIDDAMTCGSHGATLLCLGNEERLLPASVLRDAVDARIADHELKTGCKPGKRLRNEFREAALGELLPRAFIVRSRTMAYLDGRLLAVDTSSHSAAEDVATALRDALGSFPARPLACEASAALLMSEWLASGDPPSMFSLGDEVVLEDPSDRASIIAGKRCDLDAEAIVEHVRTGMQVTQLGLVFDGKISFVLDHQLRLRKLRFLDVIVDQLEARDSEDMASLLDAEFVLMVGALRELISWLDHSLRFVD